MNASRSNSKESAERIVASDFFDILFDYPVATYVVKDIFAILITINFHHNDYHMQTSCMDDRHKSDGQKSLHGIKE